MNKETNKGQKRKRDAIATTSKGNPVSSAAPAVKRIAKQPKSESNLKKHTNRFNPAKAVKPTLIKALAPAPLPPRKLIDRKNVSSNWKALVAEISVDKKPSTVSVTSKRRFSKKPINNPVKAADESDLLKVEKPDIWFDGISQSLLEQTRTGKIIERVPKDPKVKEEEQRIKKKALVVGSFDGVTKHVAMDCEMVGVGRDGKDSVLARCSIVNRHGFVIYDSFVKPRAKVTDFRTHVSGIRPADVANAPDYKTVQQQVSDLLKGKVLIGHALKNDFDVLLLNHARSNIRDTAKYKPFRKHSRGKMPSLKLLANRLLGIDIQGGEHSSVEDARTCMAIYRAHQKEWEERIRTRHWKPVDEGAGAKQENSDEADRDSDEGEMDGSDQEES